jgi:mRNA-degrading endonuclease toxin of MazEF toxin-antitoxin module
MRRSGRGSDPKRGDVYVVTLDPTLGAEMQKIRPAIVDKSRLLKRIKRIDVAPALAVLAQMFAP